MRKLFFAVALALVSLASTAQTSMKINMDPSVKPGDDFWQYAVGGWLKAWTDFYFFELRQPNK